MATAVNTQRDPAIGLVDLSAFTDGSNKQGIADAIIDSLKSIGFVYITNHGMSSQDIQDMFSWSERFFSLPMEVKQLAPHPASGTHHRGYSPPGLEKVSQHLYDISELVANRSKAPDAKESFECGREEDQTMPNIWLPEATLPGFREACLDFFWKCNKLQHMIMSALACGFHLPEDYFAKVHSAADNQLRLLHYPSVALKALTDGRVSRIDDHSDFGSFTILFQDEVGGLEVEDPNCAGQYIVTSFPLELWRITKSLSKPVPPVPNSIVLNAGDFLMRWSNDTIKSTVHHVRTPSDLHSEGGLVPERYSIPYFCCVDFSTVVDCIPGTWSEEHPKQYEPISASEYVMKRLAASY